MVRFKSHMIRENTGPNATLIAALAAGSLAAGLATATTAHGAAYSLTGLGFLSGGSTSFAYGINASGQVVGYSYTSSKVWNAFLYSGGTMSDLGTLPGGSSSYAYGINASGQIVGNAMTSSYHNHAFIYSGGRMQDLGTLVSFRRQPL